MFLGRSTATIPPGTASAAASAPQCMSELAGRSGVPPARPFNDTLVHWEAFGVAAARSAAAFVIVVLILPSADGGLACVKNATNTPPCIFPYDIVAVPLGSQIDGDNYEPLLVFEDGPGGSPDPCSGNAHLLNASNPLPGFTFTGRWYLVPSSMRNLNHFICWNQSSSSRWQISECFKFCKTDASPVVCKYEHVPSGTYNATCGPYKPPSRQPVTSSFRPAWPPSTTARQTIWKLVSTSAHVQAISATHGHNTSGTTMNTTTPFHAVDSWIVAVSVVLPLIFIVVIGVVVRAIRSYLQRRAHHLPPVPVTTAGRQQSDSGAISADIPDDGRRSLARINGNHAHQSVVKTGGNHAHQSVVKTAAMPRRSLAAGNRGVNFYDCDVILVARGLSPSFLSEATLDRLDHALVGSCPGECANNYRTIINAFNRENSTSGLEGSLKYWLAKQSLHEGEDLFNMISAINQREAERCRDILELPTTTAV